MPMTRRQIYVEQSLVHQAIADNRGELVWTPSGAQHWEVTELRQAATSGATWRQPTQWRRCLCRPGSYHVYGDAAVAATGWAQSTAPYWYKWYSTTTGHTLTLTVPAGGASRIYVWGYPANSRVLNVTGTGSLTIIKNTLNLTPGTGDFGGPPTYFDSLVQVATGAAAGDTLTLTVSSTGSGNAFIIGFLVIAAETVTSPDTANGGGVFDPATLVSLAGSAINSIFALHYNFTEAVGALAGAPVYAGGSSTIIAKTEIFVAGHVGKTLVINGSSSYAITGVTNATTAVVTGDASGFGEDAAITVYTQFFWNCPGDYPEGIVALSDFSETRLYGSGAGTAWAPAVNTWVRQVTDQYRVRVVGAIQMGTDPRDDLGTFTGQFVFDCGGLSHHHRSVFSAAVTGQNLVLDAAYGGGYTSERPLSQGILSIGVLPDDGARWPVLYDWSQQSALLNLAGQTVIAHAAAYNIVMSAGNNTGAGFLVWKRTPEIVLKLYRRTLPTGTSLAIAEGTEVAGWCHIYTTDNNQLDPETRPGESAVLSGTSYGGPDETLNGSVTLPAAGQVLSGVNRGDGTPGTLILPMETRVRHSVGYGAGGTQYTGKEVLPDEGDVRKDVGFGALDPDSEFTGTLEIEQPRLGGRRWV